MSIHKKRRKVEICHNCHTILKEDDNFCPHCGQENHDLKVPLGHLAFEVFEGFTHFDTKFYNTMVSIFFYPGKITKDFLEGRRGRYVPPIRLYFLISFIFFLGLGYMVDLALKESTDFISENVTVKDKSENVKNKAKKNIEDELEEATEKLDEIKSSEDTNGLADAQNEVKQAQLALKLYGKIDKKTEKAKIKIHKWVDFTSVSLDEILSEMNLDSDDTLRKLIVNLPEEKQRERLINIQKQIIADTINTEKIAEVSKDLRDYFTETIGKTKQLEYSLNLHALKNNASLKINYDTDTILTLKGSDGSLQNTAYLKKVLKMSDEQLDSLNRKKDNTAAAFLQPFQRGILRNLTYYQLAFREDAEKAFSEIAHLGIGAFSLMMFILMPIVALLLKIIYSKRTHSIISYPFRLLRYLWDWLLYLIRFRKIRKYRHIPHLMAGHTRYYYEHLIFSIHIHSVFFLMLLIFVGGGILLGYWKIALIMTMLGFFLYFILSLKTVYRQGIIKTLFKSVILFFLYVISFIFILSITSAFKFATS
ncbi:DUF3667 domain-containing protein [Arcicella sp. LKC2W]|uniref:DUF3667 domain-containing protein n=1 Tax=Arcicella sp. LKC2W TaxID=2984198 RepID=UPI002B215E4A|nr:DUF3667 domain-containing protein [Arcicella sp. LKC2W]MEA5460552.1 DUF3667 domain-containing protein [Arcicella sp. LKC2W]